jgi:hypothetical protein
MFDSGNATTANPSAMLLSGNYYAGKYKYSVFPYESD